MAGSSLFARLVAAAMAVAAAPLLAATMQAEVESPADPHVHTQTGMAFPAVVGQFVRRHVNHYTPDGADTGVGYDLNVDKAKVGYVSVFVYPVPEPQAKARTDGERDAACRTLFAGIERDVLSHQGTTRLTDATEVPSPSPLFRATGLHASFAGETNLAGTVRAVRDDAYLYCFAGGRWLVAYRATWPASRDASDDVKRLTEALAWPAALRR